MNPGNFVLHRHTVFSIPAKLSTPLTHGLRIFWRDFAKVFGGEATLGAEQAAQVRIGYAPGGVEAQPESFSIRFGVESGQPILWLQGADDLGLIYGLLHLSEQVLGVDPFWFWCDKAPAPQNEIRIPCSDYVSPKARVRFRGWFVNDEVCLIGWSETYPPPEATWLPVFETLLRCGGNLVIPGTDLPRHGVHWQLAAEMGLYVTHHHAEPLGAEMFFRAHPHTEASYDRNAAMFEALWQESIERQKDQQVVWTLGFRGQGDCPFWEQDPSYDTPARRGELISRVIRRQYEMLCAVIDQPPCLSYLYGEITELYRQGHIEFPPEVAKIWSDNGYGKMVSRRQGNHNPRIPSLPDAGARGRHGLYYHATFHDLQASSHLTMLPVDTDLIVTELEKAFACGVDDVWLVNCGNIRPHLYMLGLISQLWHSGHADAMHYPDAFAARYFGSASDAAAHCLRQYFSAAIQYGPHADDMAGDEFYHHPARTLVGHLMRGECQAPVPDLLWATGEQTFDAQVQWLLNCCKPALSRFAELKQECVRVADALDPQDAGFFRDFLLFQVQLHDSGCRGLVWLCQGIQVYCAGQFPQAFVLVSQSLWAFQESLDAMAAAEHEKWQHFFRADWLTNVKSTLYSVDALRKYIRMFGDNPDYFLWHKTYLMPDSEKKIYLENTHRNPLADDDLAERLRIKFGL